MATAMGDLSPTDLEKLRRLEEEVDREREDLRRRQEELKQTALAPRDGTASKAQTPAPRKETLPAKRSPAAPAAWKSGLRRNITLGTGVVLLGFAVLQNVALLITCAALVGGVWYFTGKYLGDEGEPPIESKDEAGPKGDSENPGGPGAGGHPGEPT